MARETTEAEERTRHRMIDVYRQQENLPDGFNDWGMFTAHVVHAQRMEIERLRGLLDQNGVDAGDWDDPLNR